MKPPRAFAYFSAAQRWCFWRHEQAKDRLTKVPYRTDWQKASSTNARTWSCYSVIAGRGDGAGIFLGPLGDGRWLVGIDLDMCLKNDGCLEAWAAEVADRFPTYAEVSPSGLGIKIFAFCSQPVTLKRNKITPRPKHNGEARDAEIALYVEGRYFTVTGRQWGNYDEINDCTDAVLWLANYLLVFAAMPAKLSEALQADSYLKSLWETGEHHGADKSRSAADAALANALHRLGLTRAEFAAALRAFRHGQERPLPDRRVQSLWQMAAGRRAANGTVNGEASAPTTEDALGLAFAEAHANALRHVAMWSRWMRWDGNRWSTDETLTVFDLVRRQCRDARRALPADASEKLHAILASAKTVAAVERLAKSDRRLAATVDQWDRDPDALNTPAGIIDLRTGEMRPHAFGDYCTKMTAVAPAPPGTDCPLWRAFLARIMAGDGELIRFLQRVAGYALTGLTIEHALFFCYGGGGNGKGVFLNTLTGIFGDYATIAAMETFTATNSERHPTDLAMLRGARLVSAQETEEGRRWAEAKIKALTGGDPITARFMRQDFFTYSPQFKLLIAGNHKPGLQGVDEAMRRRLNLIPFAVTIPPKERDPRLPEKLKAEWPAILRWAVDGCVEWRRRGLDQPPAVRAATEEYLADEDALGRWLDECCRRSKFAQETTHDLFTSWRKYCERTGEHAGTEKRFRENLKQRHFKPKRQAETGRGGFIGILLVRRDYTDDPRYGG